MKIRPEIQGLRAIAVLLVIAGHAFPALFPAGFIGVDIFFVISGYVITSMLIRDSDKPFSEYLVDFYARRIRRIIPSALLVLLATVFITIHILGFITGGDTARDGIWALFFLANFHFSSQAVDYFASATPLPILQHFWSLSIEEQFYLLWPALIFFAIRVTKRPALISFITISSSFIYYLVKGGAENPVTYFSTFARFWELGLGALIALTSTRFNRDYLAVLATLSFVFICIWGTNLGKNVSQITSVILAGIFVASATQSLPLISSKAMVYVGDLSYLLYLIHWPALQIPRLYFGAELSTTLRLILIATTFLLASLIHHSFEKPVRYQRLLVKSDRRTFLVAFVAFGMTYSILRMVQ